MNLKFYKLHVSGDDRILFDCESGGRLPDFPMLAASILRRRRGAGAAGFVALERTPERIWLRSFSRGGDPHPAGPVDALCAARYLFDSGRAPADRIVLDTPDGSLEADIIDSATFAVTLRPPLSPGGEEFVAANLSSLSRTVETGGRRVDIVPVRAGGFPFAVLFAASSREGPGGRPRATFRAVSDDMTAVEARIVSRSRLHVRDRGPDICACACAAAAAAAAFGFCERETTVSFGRRMPDASLREAVYVKWLDDGRLYAAARAEYCYSGEFWLADPSDSPDGEDTRD
ncbi:MAG: hypothetical protein NT080_05210 [Spirochaetes bacterium]|nr:hypothetical protein [Spirochaetota bacterium]